MGALVHPMREVPLFLRTMFDQVVARGETTRRDYPYANRPYRVIFALAKRSFTYFVQSSLAVDAATAYSW